MFRIRNKALQLEKIAEAGGDQEPDAGAAALDERVGRDRAAVGVDHPPPPGLGGGQRVAQLVDAGEDTLSGMRRGRGHLDAADRAVAGIEDEVGKGATDIGPEIASGRSQRGHLLMIVA